jgi:hypothetical protein
MVRIENCSTKIEDFIFSLMILYYNHASRSDKKAKRNILPAGHDNRINDESFD